MSETANTAQQFLDEGLAHYNRGELERAVECAGAPSRCATDPFRERIIISRACSIDLGDLEGAAEALDPRSRTRLKIPKRISRSA